MRQFPWRSTRFHHAPGHLPGLNLLVANVIFPPAQTKVITLPYNVFLNDVKAGDVASITSTSDTIQGTFRHKTGG